jgi:ribosome maturation factor RimP
MNWESAVERTVAALGYELVDCERGPRGLLRVFIDRVAGQSYETGEGQFVTVDDCEKVTRQLQYVLKVEGCNYERLEVSSPGLDRPLKAPGDYRRFAGQEIELTLKLPFQGRKKYRGVLQPEGQAWRLVYSEGKVEQALDFSLEEVREARLVPMVNFKGRGVAARSPEVPSKPVIEEVDGGHRQ